jgi:MinD-like ATPase involved in chromosome partitioning or flagellar assembly
VSSIVTFYSYKGGVGRSMALANVSVLLARRGLKVLVVDWDLEAPGLERYFTTLNVLSAGPGLLPMFIRRREGADVDYAAFTTSINCNTPHPLTLLASGREHDEAYARNLENFDWEGFFRAGGGAFVEELRVRWRADFDIVLIDSRTGLSDTGGICTIQLPDVVVGMFGANYQSLYGIRDVLRLAQKARQALPYERMPLSVLPVPARWGMQEFQQTQLWLDRVAEAMREFFDDWLPRTVRSREVIERLKVPQVDYFSFGEKLAVVEQSRTDPQGMVFSYDNVAAFLASNFTDFTALIGAATPSGAATTTRTHDESGRSEQDEDGYLYDVFVSHDRATPELVLELVEALKQRLVLERGKPRIFANLSELPAGESSDAQTGDALLRSRALLALLTPRYGRNRLAANESLTFSLRAESTGRNVLVPAIIRGNDIPDWLMGFESITDLRHSTDASATGPRPPFSADPQLQTVADLLRRAVESAPPYDAHWTLPSTPSLEPDVYPVVNDYEWYHLQQLRVPNPHRYDWRETLVQELEHLEREGLIQRRMPSEQWMGDLLPRGGFWLRDYLRLTRTGEKYVDQRWRLNPRDKWM